MGLKINKLITPYNRWIGRDGHGIEWIVVHYTANVGDTARGNAEYFASQYLGSSAHFFVDGSSVWQSVELEDSAWHCGDAPSKNGATNRNSIGIEMCTTTYKRKYAISAAVFNRTVKLARELLKTYPDAKICRHYDVTGKVCPEPWVRVPGEWDKFLEKVGIEPMTAAEREMFEKLQKKVEELEKKNAEREKEREGFNRALDAVDKRTAVKYDRFEDCPDWLKPTVKKLIERGHLKGDQGGHLSLTYDMARLLVVFDRAGGFDE